MLILSELPEAVFFFLEAEFDCIFLRKIEKCIHIKKKIDMLILLYTHVHLFVLVCVFVCSRERVFEYFVVFFQSFSPLATSHFEFRCFFRVRRLLWSCWGPRREGGSPTTTKLCV